jgi:FkbM family methyltransferase
VLAAHGITLVLDIGANEGQYAERLRRAGYAGRIVSFEPQAAAHSALSGRAAGDPAWQVAPPLALGEAAGKATLNLSADSGMSSLHGFDDGMAELLDSARFVGSEEVATDRLDAVFDSYAGANDQVLVKIDTQGSEEAVLAGGAGVLQRIRLFQVELSLVPVYAEQPDWRTMVAWFDSHGFDLVLIIPGYFNRRTARLIEMDGLFARRDAGAVAPPP